jgi:hypothetical protein
MSLRIVPVSFRDACGFVQMWHRHHGPPAGCKFCIGAADDGDVLVGVAIVGRPAARCLDDGLTLEVTRTATDGTRNANSLLYAAAWRASRRECGVITHARPRSAGRSRKTRQNVIRSRSMSLTVSIRDGGLASKTASDPANGST